jgi:hypothetical protein
MPAANGHRLLGLEILISRISCATVGLAASRGRILDYPNDSVDALSLTSQRWRKIALPCLLDGGSNAV